VCGYACKFQDTLCVEFRCVDGDMVCSV